MGSKRDRRSEIGLARDQDERKAGQKPGHEQVACRRSAAAVLAEKLREHERHADFGEFRGLKVEGSQRNPAAGAAGRSCRRAARR